MVDDAELESGRFAGEFGAFESVMHEEGLNSEMKVLVDVDLERIVAEVVASGPYPFYLVLPGTASACSVRIDQMHRFLQLHSL